MSAIKLLKKFTSFITGKIFAVLADKSQPRKSQPHEKLIVPGSKNEKAARQQPELSEFTIF